MINNSDKARLLLGRVKNIKVETSPNHFFKEENVRWVEVLTIPEKGLRLGISMQGNWVRAGNGDVVVIDQDDKIMPLLPCLEVDKPELYRILKLDLAARNIPEELASTFPQDELVAYGLFSGSEHWMRLSMAWAEKDSLQIKTLDALKKIAFSSDKKIAQHIKHKAKKIIKSTENGHRSPYVS